MTKRENIIYWGLALLVFTYLIFRVLFVPPVFDELWTLFHYVRPKNIDPFGDYGMANNHLINTVISYVFHRVFGESIFVLRLPNLLAFIVFAYYLKQLAGLLTNQISRWGLIISFLFCLTFIDFFGVSRGYGISYAFLFAGFYYVLKLLSNNSVKLLVLASVALFVAWLSNFTLSVLILLCFATILFIVLKNKDFYLASKNKLKTISLSLISFIGVVFISLVIWKMKEKGYFYWGNADGFWETTVKSLFHLLLDIKNPSNWLSYILLGFTVALGYFVFNKPLISKSKIIYLWLLLSIEAVILMTAIFKMNYPYQRIGMHLFILFVLAIVFVSNKLKSNKLRLAVLAPLVAFILIPIYGINFNHINCWEEDAIPERFVNKVAELEKENNNALSIYSEGASGYTWAYYIDKNKLSLPPVVECTEADLRNYDYIIDLAENLDSLRDLYDSIDYDEASTHLLLKRKTTTNKALIEKGSLTDFDVSDQEFIEVLDFSLDSMKSTSLYAELEIIIEAQIPSFQNWLVVSVDDQTNNENLAYKKLRLDWKNNWTKNDKVVQGIYLNGLPRDRDLKGKIYFWNIKKKPFKIVNSNVSLWFVDEPYHK